MSISLLPMHMMQAHLNVIRASASSGGNFCLL